MSNDRQSLIKIIGQDLLYHNKLQLLLLIIALISAEMVISITYKTRFFTVEHEKMILEKNALDIEWRNLLAKKNTLGNSSRVEHIATEKLQMRYVDSSKENILIQP